MLINIDQVNVTDRIRKDFGDLQELAEDIKENGLINPPVVTPEYELIAGERRLRALKALGYRQVEVRVMSVKDAEHQLNLEISENETRKDFSKKERINYGRQLEQIERLKARKRQEQGKDLGENFHKGRTTDIVAEKMGIGSGRQYEKEKFIVDHADPETLDAWDNGDITTHKAYIALKDEVKSLQAQLKNTPSEAVIVPPPDYKETKAELEKLKTDLEMAEFKNQQLKRRMDEDNTPELFQQMAKKESEAQLKIIELNKKIDQMEADSKTIEHKVKKSSITFCGKVHNFLTDVGGLAWINDYADLLDGQERKDYLTALNALEGWLYTIKNNIEGE